ncbi:ABC tran, AAA 21 and/or SbcCD C domain containing protein, partial [Asbolus verrucosus]
YKVVEDFEDITKVKNEFFETNPDVNPGIQIINLRKVFGKKIAVKNLSLNIYENQIHVLLGHNGAGKTTTMSMLTGIIPPTSGRAVVCGYNIRTNMKDIRANLGLCPQHNILFDDLTVKEHIYFFSKLKGLGKSNIDEEIRKYVQLLELQPKIDKKSKTLSGGMKRKLCVCIALCGNSKVVLLDEPTAGMDPSSRRNLWDLLQTQKQGRCILLTTHYMDEADVLGDRISIMANGELKCSGSSFFLKKKYGTGYRLILEKSPMCDPNKVTRFLKVYIPNIQIHSNIASELTYLLSEDHVSVFETMFQNLEANTEKLGIRSFGISLNTLEEVFKKVVNDNPSENSPQFSAKISKTKFADSPPQTKTSVVSVSSKKLRFSTGFDLIMNQFIAMFMKKLLSIFRTWILQFIQILIPVSFLMIAIIVSRNMNKHKYGNLPKLLLVLDSYKNPITLVEDDGINPFSKFYFESLKDYDVSKVPSINTTMLEITKNFRARSRKRYIVGASFMQEGRNITTIKAWFNNDPYHAAPLALALVLDAIYKKFLGKDHKITFANYPLPFSSDTKVQRLLKGNSKGFQLAFNIGFSMAFVSSFYVLFYVKERVCKSKHLQFASGVKGCIFWITAFLCDLMTFIVTILAVIITLLCFQEEGFRTVRDLATGIRDSYTTFAASKMCDFFVTNCMDHQPNTTFDNCWYLACNNNFSNALTTYCCVRNQDYFKWESPGIGRNVLYSFLFGSILFLLLNAVEYRFFSKMFDRLFGDHGNQVPQKNSVEDEDVLREKEKVHSTPEMQLLKDHVVVLKDVTKYYKNFLAVNGLCLGIQQFECFAHDFDFYQHLNKKVKQLSGGNKRKLSTAISLIGDPPVICLDEPTAGMDPVTKRNLWNAICTIRDNGKCLVFTSHSMEECEALCTRLAVMVNGNFECMGSIQHLKNKFAAGYMLTIKLKRAKKSELATDIKKIEQFVSSHFPTATQQEKHQELLTYYIADNVDWSKMFGILERAKNELNIEDYSLGQSNLEQVY